MSLEAIRYSSEGELQVLDQLLLPHQSVYVKVKDTQDGWNVIKNMQVRGAPAIGIVGCLSLAVELRSRTFDSAEKLVDFVTEKLKYLVTARPTAVNMADAERTLTKQAKALLGTPGLQPKDIKSRLVWSMEATLAADVKMNRAMGGYGADHLLERCNGDPVKVLTHCNTGSLATGGYGTALGVVRTLHERSRLLHCYCTETRPYNQGARLTAYELVHDKLPATLVCDSMASMLMKQRGISAVFVGADRIVSNGDTANKIGTYQLAIAAKYHGVPFYVVAPSTSCDLTLDTGDQIVIEERPHNELTSINGKRIAAEGIGVWNPAFDVTPAELITGGIVTEVGVFEPADFKSGLTAALNQKQNEDS